MTYFQDQLMAIKAREYPPEYLIAQLMEARAFMEAHYDQKISLEDLARAACLSKYYFNRLFKRLYGRTPIQCLTSVRIEKAKELLRSGTKVSQVCFDVGFESVGNFTSLFKQATGRRPRAFSGPDTRELSKGTPVPLKYYPPVFMEKK